MAQIGTIKIQTASGTKSVPVFSTGDSGSNVLETLRVETASGVGFVPLADPADATHNYLRVQTGAGVKAVHDSASVTSATELTADVTLNGQSATAIVYEDTDSDGTAENTETVSLSNGSNTYTLNNLSGSGDYWIEWQLSNSDVTSTAVANSAQLQNVGTWDTAAEWDGNQSESGVAHESTSNTDHGNAAVVKQGYSYASFNNITPNPTACWPLHENSGSTAYDVAGSYDGTINNSPQLGQTGILGTTSYSFDGSDDYIEISGTDSTLRPASAVTVTAWVNVSSSGKVYSGGEAGGGAGSNGYLLQVDGNGYANAAVTTGSRGNQHIVKGSTSITDGNWHHIALTYDSSNIKVFVDGSQDASETESGNINYSSYNHEISKVPWTSGGYITGNIADVRVYAGTALSQSQIQALYDVANTQGTLTTGTKSS